MMRWLPPWILATVCSVPSVCPAEEPSPLPAEGVWTGKGQAGYTSTQGNTDAKSANAALDAGFLNGPWKHAFHLGGLYGESAGLVSAERWDTGWQTNYDLSKRVFSFGGLRYERDMFSGFQYQATVTAGIGYKIRESEALKLNVQVGAGYRELRPEALTYNGAGRVTSRTLQSNEGSAVGTAGILYAQSLTKTTTLTDKLLIESGSTDTLVTNTLALAVKISTKLALSIGYTVQDNSKPPPPLKKIDTLETVNLVYAF